MTSLTFDVLDVAPEPYAAAPQLTARLRIVDADQQPIHAIALRCQVRIEPQRRPYTRAEEPGLLGLFGTRTRWPDTLRPFLWLQCSAMVQGFRGATEVDLPLPCTYDFEVAASQYLHALRDGTVPLAFLFSGTVFTRGVAGFGVEHIPWDREAAFHLPVQVWHRLMELYFPNTGWLRLDRDIVTALAHFRAARGLTSWDAAVEALLAAAEEPVP